ncbi:MAG TPA: CDP-alcohol phosphatidyltransferase family protein [Dehalococcoidia bacterium]|nr:CDP-alcohol phosphatidyltransferase family protein [Dehalococcoidia bacterium]
MSLEGPVSRYLNRRLSRPLARALAHTPATPNQVSVAAALLAAGALALLGAGRNIEAGVLIQASSIVDGADGDLARLKGMASRFGAVFDAVLDRYADAAVIGGLAWWAAAREEWPAPLLMGLAALVGALSVSYSRARIEHEGGRDVAGAVIGLASRDVRMLALAIGAVVGQAYWTLAAVAALSWLTVAWRLFAGRGLLDRAS